jgi:hypothetical protein
MDAVDPGGWMACGEQRMDVSRVWRSEAATSGRLGRPSLSEPPGGLLALLRRRPRQPGCSLGLFLKWKILIAVALVGRHRSQGLHHNNATSCSVFTPCKRFPYLGVLSFGVFAGDVLILMTVCLSSSTQLIDRGVSMMIQ